MASNESNVEDIREFCSLCFESYRDRTPKLLPCFHTFCITCLNSLTKTGVAEDEHELKEKTGGGEGAKGGVPNVEAGVSFPCPTCQKVVTVPEKGVSAFQTNFYIVTERNQPRAAPLPCQMCEEVEEEARDAMFVCDKCQQRMCQPCRRKHDAIINKVANPQEHKVQPLASSSAGHHEIKPCLKCSLHTDQELCFFCKTCDKTICLKCKLTGHQPHETQDMASATLQAKEEVRGLVATAKVQIQSLQKSVGRLTRDAKELDRQKEEVTEEVKTHSEELIRWVKRSRGELLDTVSAKADIAAAGLKAEEVKVQNNLTTLTRLVTSSSKISSNNPEILVLKDKLQAALLKDDEFEYFKTLGDTEDLKTFFQLNSDPDALDLAMIKAFIGDLNTSGKRVASVPLTEKINQTTQIVTDLQTKMAATEQQLQQAVENLEVRCQTSEQLAQVAEERRTTLEMKVDEEIVTTKDEIKAAAADLEKKLQAVEKQAQDAATSTTALDTKVQSAETRLDTVQKRVAFTAWNSANPLSTPANSTLILDHAPVNIGSGYDPATGIFTVPVSGLYDIQGTIMAHTATGKLMYATLYVDNTKYGLMVSDSQHGSWDQSSIRAVVQLNQGQKVCLHNDMASVGAYYSETNEPYTSFSGCLLQAD